MEVGGEITGSGVLAKVMQDWREYWYRNKTVLRGFEIFWERPPLDFVDLKGTVA